MIVIDMVQAEASAQHRKPGFLEAIRDAAVSTTESTVTVSDDDYDRISKDYRIPGAPSRFLEAMAKWRKAGYALAPDQELLHRQEACRGCQDRKELWWGFGCRVCGCTGVKLHLATEKCPVGKW